MPGPGAYSILRGGEKPSTRKDGAGFGSSTRGSIAEGKRGPGPGQYNPSNPVMQANSYSIGSSQRKGMSKREKVPGPGSYNVPSYIADVPRYSMP